MSSSKDHVEYIVEQLGIAVEDSVSSRAMMGEYVIYLRDKVLGGVYDNRLLIKPTKSAQRMLAGAPLEIPYEGAKEMILVEDLSDREFIRELLEAMYAELPARKPRKKK